PLALSRIDSLPSSAAVFLECYCHHGDLHSFPTRRSSDLLQDESGDLKGHKRTHAASADSSFSVSTTRGASSVPSNRMKVTSRPADRKSTRLNSSHVKISYAVFCLKKKKDRWGAAQAQLGT